MRSAPESPASPGPPDRARLRAFSLSRWENEGGAGQDRRTAHLPTGEPGIDVPPLTCAELVQMRVRLIALENVAIALLAHAADQQLDLVREMADHISPRPGFTAHPLTMRAADQMLSLIDRAQPFRLPPLP